MPISTFPQFIRKHYEIHEWRHASAILQHDFPSEYSDICDILTRFRLNKSFIAIGGGRKSPVANWIDGEFYKKGWVEKNFDTKITIDQNEIKSPTHSVDCFKNRVAMEKALTNDDPFIHPDLSGLSLAFDSLIIDTPV